MINRLPVFPRRLALLSRASASAVRPGLIRRLHMYQNRLAVKPFMLADIGEGIKECEVIQWFVEPGATVEEFDLICEVQSDKASVEITSRYNGVIKKLHYEPGQMAIVGKPLIDIDIPEEEGYSTPVSSSKADTEISTGEPVANTETATIDSNEIQSGERLKTFATPAVRRLCKEFNLNIAQIQGKGKDGRVLKEDVLRYNEELQAPSKPSRPAEAVISSETSETVSPLTPIQRQMFNTMTRSLNIPHFLYSDEVELDNVAKLRKTINEELAQTGVKLSFMPFFIKALSLSLNKFPALNSKVLIDDKGIPSIVNRPQHNIGIAMDTPVGLIVPNIKNVQSLSILEIGAELLRLQAAGSKGKLTAADLTGGTITLSNIGTIGGTYLGPVIVDSEVAIGGLGKAKVVPRFNSSMEVVPRKVLNTSWSGDHRVLDGVTMARMVDQWKSYVEKPEKMMLHLK